MQPGAGDAAGLIAEMKRRAGVSTDLDLSRALGLAQSTGSYWRSRGAVPEASILRAERALAERALLRSARATAARALLFRPGGLGGGDAEPVLSGRLLVPCLALAEHFLAAWGEAERQLEALERQRGLTPREAFLYALDDPELLKALLEWVLQFGSSMGGSVVMGV